ncbi:unnamed protein product [Arctia plantaginis]|uniref:Prominin-like protein n=1 Tax=Arctia plantaginis TaxID=874455 RepID=A0A8S1A3P3_ARCPL|nr:unnamed protein product [Arctia plantaginis]
MTYRGVVTVSDGHLYVSPLKKEWRKWVSHYLGPIGIVVLALLIAVILPLTGLFWCCCYWCRVGRRRRPFDREYDSWIRGMLAILFIGLLTLFLLGLVCVFATESHLDDNVGDLTTVYRAGLGDAIKFLNKTQEEAIWLLERNFYEVKSRLIEVLYGLGGRTTLMLSETSNLMAVSTLNRMVQQLDDVYEDLRTVQNLTNSLRVRAVDLNSGLRKVKNQLLQTLSKCDQPKCLALHNKYKIGQLDTEIQYSQMPDVSPLLQNVSALLSSGLKEEVAEGHKVFRNIQRTIQSSVEEQLPEVRFSIDKLGENLIQLGKQIRGVVGNVTRHLQAHLRDADRVQEVMDEYGTYRQYLGVAAALCLLLMCAIMTWGLVVGVCGGRPEVYGAHDCCSKAGGARSLLCGVAVLFTLGGFVAVVFVVYFVAGVAAQRVVCDPLMYPIGNRLFNDLDKMVDLERTLYGEKKDETFTLAGVLVRCHMNYTLYELLQLRRVVDLANLPLGLRAGPLALGGARPLLGDTDLRIMRPHTLRKLRQFAESGLADFDFDRILDALETNMTSLALDSLARQLNSTAHSLQQPQFQREARDLLQAAADLERLNRRVLAPLLDDAAVLNETTTRLRDGMRWGGWALDKALEMLTEQTAAAQKFILEKGDELSQMALQHYGKIIAEKLNEFIKHATFYLRNNVGRCEPISRVFNSTRDSFCVKVVQPINGYWMALGWCILLFVPLVLTAQRLAELYMQIDPYPGPLVEAEYLYDAYADRDNVPLANAYKAEKRSGRDGRDLREGREGREARGGRAREGEGRGGGAGPARVDSALAPPLDAYHARRYNDMAPKHWEEGPPRYHGPTEYERPPPYYYPGPNDRQ